MKQLVAPPHIAFAFRDLIKSGIQLQVDLVDYESALVRDAEIERQVDAALNGLNDANSNLARVQEMHWMQTQKCLLLLAHPYTRTTSSPGLRSFRPSFRATRAIRRVASIAQSLRYVLDDARKTIQRCSRNFIL